METKKFKSIVNNVAKTTILNNDGEHYYRATRF